MKKVSLLTAVSLIAAQSAFADSGVAVPASAPCPNCFKGFFLGGNVGYGIGGAKQQFAEHVAGSGHDYAIGSKPLGIRGVDGGINVGYNYVFANKFGLGLEFVANWASSDGKTTFLHTDAGALVGDGAQARAKLNNSLQLRANFSYVIANVVAPKIILGWDNSQWKQTFASNLEEAAADPVFKSQKKHRLNGFLWGLGVDFCAMKHVIFGFEYTGTIASSKSYNVVDPATGNDYKASFKPQYNKFALTAKVIY